MTAQKYYTDSRQSGDGLSLYMLYQLMKAFTQHDSSRDIPTWASIHPPTPDTNLVEREYNGVIQYY